MEALQAAILYTLLQAGDTESLVKNNAMYLLKTTEVRQYQTLLMNIYII